MNLDFILNNLGEVDKVVQLQLQKVSVSLFIHFLRLSISPHVIKCRNTLHVKIGIRLVFTNDGVGLLSGIVRALMTKRKSKIGFV